MIPSSTPCQLLFFLCSSFTHPVRRLTHHPHMRRFSGATTSEEPSYHGCKKYICQKIRSLLLSLNCHSPKYREVASKVEYWIEYALHEHFITVGELVEGVSYVAWDDGGDPVNVGQFLREFRDAPRRSEQAKSFVVQLCRRILRWFAVAQAQDTSRIRTPLLRNDPGFLRAASLVGHLIEQGLLSHELVRRHLVKPLINHDYSYHDNLNSRNAAESRTLAIDRLFTAGNSLLRDIVLLGSGSGDT